MLCQYVLLGKSAKRNYYHNIAYNNSDVDLFLYGLETEEQANQKLMEIYETITDAGMFVKNHCYCYLYGENHFFFQQPT